MLLLMRRPLACERRPSCGASNPTACILRQVAVAVAVGFEAGVGDMSGASQEALSIFSPNCHILVEELSETRLRYQRWHHSSPGARRNEKDTYLVSR
jgi:hypothetical protein